MIKLGGEPAQLGGEPAPLPLALLEGQAGGTGVEGERAGVGERDSPTVDVAAVPVSATAVSFLCVLSWLFSQRVPHHQSMT